MRNKPEVETHFSSPIEEARESTGTRGMLPRLQIRLFDSAILRTPGEAIDFITNILESSTQDSVIGKDVDGKILFWNEGARRLYGYEPDEVVGRANSSYRKMRVLYMSGYAGDAIVKRGALEPGVAFLQKPFEPDVLVHKVREVLDQ